MSRRREVAKREILPDPKYGSEVVAKFINCVMHSGKKSVAEKIVYTALERAADRTKGRNKAVDEEGRATTAKSNAGFMLDIFERALDNVKPSVEVRARRVGGSTYQIPVEVRPSRRLTLAMRWLIESALARGEKTMSLRLAGEILDAIDGKGGAVKKREDMHRMAKANQAFAHFRWTNNSESEGNNRG